MGTELWPDFTRFTKLAVETRDVDPVYPVLNAYLRGQGIEPGEDDAMWLSVAHLTWYDMGSALNAWHEWDLSQESPNVTLRCATERRGNRDPNQLEKNLASWRSHAKRDGLAGYLIGNLPGDPRRAWQEVMNRIERVHGNGRWASYKLAEILIKVNEVPLEPYHMGHANSSGPRRGLELIIDNLPQGDRPEDIEFLDDMSAGLVAGLQMRLPGMKLYVEEVETTLCDFHALHDGRYYVGNDIDQMQQQLMDRPGHWTDDVLQARYDSLPHAYLGELNGWVGIDKARQKAYKETGEILTR